MPYEGKSLHKFFIGGKNRNLSYPINPHRYYKKITPTQPDDPYPWRPPVPNTECGYEETLNEDGSICYVKEYIVNKITVLVRICVMPDGSMHTTHEVGNVDSYKYTHGVRIINDIAGNTDCRTITKDFMLKTLSPITGGAFKTHSELYPRYNYLTQVQIAERFLNRNTLVSAIAGAGTFTVALFWLWRAIMFYHAKKIGFKKRIIFRTLDRTPRINQNMNQVGVEKEGLYYNFNFTLQRGEKGDKTICKR